MTERRGWRYQRVEKNRNWQKTPGIDSLRGALPVGRGGCGVAGLADDAAGLLADTVAGGTVARINPALTGDGNLALPPPPAGLWERWEAAAV